MFTPGGGAASIGDDGKPIMAKHPSTDEHLGEAKTMQIGDDGKPIEAK